jgi:DNA polymerase delta subunit 4
MPPKRRSSGPATRSSTQSTLAFHGATNKVTKPTSGTRSQKKDSLAHPISSLQKADLSAPSDSDPTSPTTVEAAILEQAAQEAAAQAVALTPEEEEASHVTEARIKKYWAAKEDARKAPRVHQQALGLHEKVLREWDTSGQYGVCSSYLFPNPVNRSGGSCAVIWRVFFGVLQGLLSVYTDVF